MAKHLSYKYGILQDKKDLEQSQMLITRELMRIQNLIYIRIIVVYDTTNKPTFESIDNYWINEIESFGE